ncbi:hypothetical protein AO287_04705 [Pseudomonas savastanoi]|uniref:Uncharacterized protein n=1 Tax=Pseudomonas savastanoi TaxID=29438 RepID=A0AAW3M7L0_PSESS|nr:hypothetical protein AO287_04705 [Pseudomonas savastanoi]
MLCKSIHHMGSDRASCRMRIALGENHRQSGVTFKIRVTWGAVIDSVCNSGLRLWTMFVKQSDFRDLAPVDKTIPQWTSVVFHRRKLCQQFFS